MRHAWNTVARDLELTENDNSNSILLFMFYLGSQVMRLFRGIKMFILFSHKNNQEGRMKQLEILVFKVSYFFTIVFAFDRLKIHIIKKYYFYSSLVKIEFHDLLFLRLLKSSNKRSSSSKEASISFCI